MLRIIFAIVFMTGATPAFAQIGSGEGHGSAYMGDHAGHDHDADPNDEMQAAGDLRLADQAELTAALAAGGEPIVAKVLGAVCDFCAKAMNKTFGKREDVAAVYVDLDAKTLNVVMKPGKTMTDRTLIKTVKKSGYKVDKIARGPSTIPS